MERTHSTPSASPRRAPDAVDEWFNIPKSGHCAIAAAQHDAPDQFPPGVHGSGPWPEADELFVGQLAFPPRWTPPGNRDERLKRPINCAPHRTATPRPEETP